MKVKAVRGRRHDVPTLDAMMDNEDLRLPIGVIL